MESIDFKLIKVLFTSPNEDESYNLIMTRRCPMIVTQPAITMSAFPYVHHKVGPLVKNCFID